MITKATFKVKKSPIDLLLYCFSSRETPEAAKIEKIISDLNKQKLSLAFDEKGRYYVNKIDNLCKLMNDLQCVSIFRPRRMGKTTMIKDIEFLYNTGMLLCLP